MKNLQNLHKTYLSYLGSIEGRGRYNDDPYALIEDLFIDIGGEFDDHIKHYQQTKHTLRRDDPDYHDILCKGCDAEEIVEALERLKGTTK